MAETWQERQRRLTAFDYDQPMVFDPYPDDPDFALDQGEAPPTALDLYYRETGMIGPPEKEYAPPLIEHAVGQIPLISPLPVAEPSPNVAPPLIEAHDFGGGISGFVGQAIDTVRHIFTAQHDPIVRAVVSQPIGAVALGVGETISLLATGETISDHLKVEPHGELVSEPSVYFDDDLDPYPETPYQSPVGGGINMHGGTSMMPAGLMGQISGPPAEIIAYTWTTYPGGPTFYRLVDGRIAVQKKNGVWRVYRPQKHIVISRNPGVKDLMRANKRLATLTRGLDVVVKQSKARAPKKGKK